MADRFQCADFDAQLLQTNDLGKNVLRYCRNMKQCITTVMLVEDGLEVGMLPVSE